jgi:thiol-disulfide isomerase/thioredoxin
MRWTASFAAIVFTVSFLANAALNAQINPNISGMAPEFTHQQAEEWINSKPLSIKDLKGQVVLIDFWTFDCWNCYRSFPWLNELEKKYAQQGLKVIGVHTPEFDHEKIRANIEAKVKKFKLHHPVMIDNDFSYWRAFNNRYWPAFYLIDQEGKVVYQHVGETHKDDHRARALEKKLKALLKL